MILPEWKRIAAVQFQDDGTVGAVWLAHDTEKDTIHLYDTAIFRKMALNTVAESINARGRWIPLAWDQKDMSDKLVHRGCNTLSKPCGETPQSAEESAADIAQRMESARFKVARSLAEWLDEFSGYKRNAGRVPIGTHPLMTATRYAVASLSYAKRQGPRRIRAEGVGPKLAII